MIIVSFGDVLQDEFKSIKIVNMRYILTLWFSYLEWRISALTDIFCVAESIAVMSVDLGSEWMKIAIVKPGVPMEIALNK